MKKYFKYIKYYDCFLFINKLYYYYLMNKLLMWYNLKKNNLYIKIQ